MENINIYVVTHKKFPMPEEPMYKPIQVGSFQNEDLGYVRDDSGDNISLKNKNYCELTGLYWLWKNEKVSDIIGICQYRRYFYKEDHLLTQQDVIESLNQYDIIVPISGIPLYDSILHQYNEWHNIDDLLICGEVIQEKCPEYYEAFLLFLQSKLFTIGNMMIMRKPLYDNYCEWLFDILFEVEQRIDISSYNEYQQRIFGFLAERLHRIWLMNQSLRIREQLVHRVDENFQIQKGLGG